MKVGFVYDSIYLKHDTGILNNIAGPSLEKVQKFKAIIHHLEKSKIKQRLTVIKPRPATIEELAAVHHKQYISYIQEFTREGGGLLEPYTVVSPDSYEVATYAAGGAIRATEAVMDGRVNSAFALVRPPGHHATSHQAMGFCLFNNIAVSAKYALAAYGLERVAIIDFDVHHGNGTQEIFNDNPQVLYVSVHEFPSYPGSGSLEETGSGKAKGTKVNVPLGAGSSDSEYLQVFEQVIAPIVRRFKPQLLLVSAGYDPHWADAIGRMNVTTSGFARIVSILKRLAEELCNSRLVFYLEGGYNDTALATSVKATFDVLLGNTDIEDLLGEPPLRLLVPNINIAPLIQSIKRIHNLA
jgi:acetoin utilization deacetylase AcuC-like enzyme